MSRDLRSNLASVVAALDRARAGDAIVRASVVLLAIALVACGQGPGGSNAPGY